MKDKLYKVMWIVSFVIIAANTILSYSKADVPDMVTRVMGVLTLVAVAALIFSSIKMGTRNKIEQQNPTTSYRH